MTPETTPNEPTPPMLRVVRGEPTPEELAAVVAVLVATSAAPAPAEPEPRGQWRSRGRNIRPAAARGPDAWRTSGYPR